LYQQLISTSQCYNSFHNSFWSTEWCSQLQNSVSHGLQWSVPLASGSECYMPF